MGEVFVWRFFNELVIKPFVWGEKADDAVIRNTTEVEIPQVLDYLEGEIPADGLFFFGEIGIADVAVSAFLRNAAFAGFTIDPGRWPRTAGLVSRTLDHPSFQKLRPFEELLLKTPIGKHREALAELGAPLSPTTFGTRSPRRGVLST
jgi:glutathione S-transferase